MAKLVGLKFSLQGQLREDKQTNCFVSYCPALDIYAAGKSRPEAKDALRATIALFIQICYERGIFGVALRERGFLAAEGGDVPVLTDSQEFITIQEDQTAAPEYDDVFEVDVPMHLVAAAQRVATSAQEACLP